MGMNITPQDRADYVKAHPEATELTEQELDAKIVAEKQKAGEEMQEGLSSKDDSFIDETAAWIKENPAETALIGAGTIALGILGKRAGVFAKAGKFLAGLFQGHAKTVGVAVAGGAMALGATSCSFKQSTDLRLKIEKDDQSAIIAAFNQGYSALIEKLNELGYTLSNILGDILNVVTQNNEDLKSILTALQNGNMNQEEILNMLLCMNTTINALGETIVTQLVDISNGIKDNAEAQKETQRLLQLIFDAVKNLGDEFKSFGQQILSKLGTIIKQNGANAHLLIAGFNKILETLNSMDRNNTEGQKHIQELLTLIMTADETHTNAILEALATGGDKIMTLFTKYGDGIMQLIQKYGDRITNILNKHTGQMNLIINLIGKYGEGILDAIDKYGDAITKIGDKMDVIINLIENSNKSLDEIKALLEAINNNTVSNGQKLDVIIANMNQYKTEILKAIQELQGSVNDVYVTVGNFKGSISAYYQLVLNKLEVIINQANGGNCNCNMDMDKLMEKLQEILEAIKNHKCECNCNHGDGGNHEGILGDLEDILG